MDPKDIAKLLSEDIRENNGLISEDLGIRAELAHYFGGSWNISGNSIEGTKRVVIGGGYDDYAGVDVRSEREYNPQTDRNLSARGETTATKTFSIMSLENGELVDKEGNYSHRLEQLPGLKQRIIDVMLSEAERQRSIAGEQKALRGAEPKDNNGYW